MTDHRNVVRQNYFRDIGDVMLVRNLFRLIRVIKRTNSRPIWTPTCEDIDHNAKITSFTLPKKKSPHKIVFFGSRIIFFQTLTTCEDRSEGAKIHENLQKIMWKNFLKFMVSKWKLTWSILKSRSSRSTLVSSTHFGFYERIRTNFQKFKT